MNPTVTRVSAGGWPQVKEGATYFRYNNAFPNYRQTPNSRPVPLYPHTFGGLPTNPTRAP